MNTNLERPIARSKARKILGKEFYILKRKLKWLLTSTRWAKTTNSERLPFLVFQHRSTLLRRLRNVDMQLQYNKIVNLQLATRPLDGILIRPGESFSIWYLVGRPTAQRGYKEGLILADGQITSGTGGGLCQLGNLLYWIALHSPLTVVERWRHSYDVFPDVNRTIPFGCGATLSYNYVDLILRNDTEHTFQIALWLDDEYLHGALYSDKDAQEQYEIIESEHAFLLQWWGAYVRHNRIDRIVTGIATGQTRKEFITKNDAFMMYEPLLGEGKQ